MSTRENILAAISNNKPALVDLPVIDIKLVSGYDDLVAKFTATLESIGGSVVQAQSKNEIELNIKDEIAQGHLIIDAMGDHTEITSAKSATDLEAVHKAYINGTLGVAENGAVWIKESQMINRLLPFICQHLVIVLEKEKLVATMHQAYQQVNSFEEGFGVFIAGPSKTADIEQSLVIGAHGARSLTVYLLN